MLDFLKKRVWKKKVNIPSDVITGKKSKKPVVDSAPRMAAVAEAEQLPDDENIIVEFILNSSFAEARYVAAQKLHTKEMLEKVRQQVHKTDGRVTKLMQSRLNEIQRREKQHSGMRQCIQLAENLKNEDQLHPGSVAELDRQWADMTRMPSGETALQKQYETIREDIRVRLENQTILQRQIMDALTKLEDLDSQSDITPSEREIQLENILESVEDWKKAREWAAMPQRLIRNLEEATARIEENTQLHAQNHAAVLAHESALEQWEAQEVSALSPGEMHEQWSALPEINDSGRKAEMQQRFNALIDNIQIHVRNESASSQGAPKLLPKEVESLFSYSLSLMQDALREGAVREALRQNEQLTRLDYSVFEPDASQQALLAELRAELKNLEGWARWSGEVSREEIIRAAEALPSQNYPLRELAAAVVDIREKWKALNQTAGMATRSQWLQFDAACNRAYEPVVEYARSQLVAREQNIQKAQTLIQSAREMMTVLDLDSLQGRPENSVNWRHLIESLRQAQRAWRQIGSINRREKKLLDDEFEQILQPLNTLVHEQTKIQVQAREELIEAVKKLKATDHRVSRKVRQYQEQWQEKARAFPLDNREDQKLWTRFRSVCEAVFAHRAKLHEEAEKEFGAHLELKNSICAQLEEATPDSAEKILQILKEADAAWDAAGAVSKEMQTVTQNRYDEAVERLLAQLNAIRDKEKNQSIQALIEKLSICQKLERAIPEEPELLEDLQALWHIQPSDAWQELLQSRFDAASKALKEKDGDYATMLQARQSMLMEQLLRLEVIVSVESPAELAVERRQVQMAVLKDSLSGNRDAAPAEQLEELCMLAVLTDASAAQRLERLVRKINGLPI